MSNKSKYVQKQKVSPFESEYFPLMQNKCKKTTQKHRSCGQKWRKCDKMQNEDWKFHPSMSFPKQMRFDATWSWCQVLRNCWLLFFTTPFSISFWQCYKRSEQERWHEVIIASFRGTGKTCTERICNAIVQNRRDLHLPSKPSKRILLKTTTTKTSIIYTLYVEQK